MRVKLTPHNIEGRVPPIAERVKKLLAAQLRELTKNLKNFLQGQDVSGNLTKLPYYRVYGNIVPTFVY